MLFVYFNPFYFNIFIRYINLGYLTLFFMILKCIIYNENPQSSNILGARLSLTCLEVVVDAMQRVDGIQITKCLLRQVKLSFFEQNQR